MAKEELASLFLFTQEYYFYHYRVVSHRIESFCINSSPKMMLGGRKKKPMKNITFMLYRGTFRSIIFGKKNRVPGSSPGNTWKIFKKCCGINTECSLDVSVGLKKSVWTNLFSLINFIVKRSKRLIFYCLKHHNMLVERIR